MKRGPIAKISQPSTEYYKCVVKDCKAIKIRGDEVSSHFQSSANLIILEHANEKQLLMKKNLQAGVTIDISKDNLTELLSKSTEQEKGHTIYMFNHGFSSINLPNYNSVGFKCQQKKAPYSNAWKGFNIVPKKSKMSENIDNESSQINTVSENKPSATVTSEREENIESEQNLESEKIDTPQIRPESVAGPETVVGSESVARPETEAKIETNSDFPIEANSGDFFEKLQKIVEKAINENLKKNEGKLASEIVAQILQANKIEKQKEEITFEDFWVENDEYWVCNPCLFYSCKGGSKLQGKKRGNFGYVSKSGEKFHVTSNKKRHVENPLHVECVKEYKKKAAQKFTQEEENEKLGKKIIRNAILCLKRDWSSEDFLALNEKNYLDEKDLETSYVPTKNDSKAAFFKHRNVIFDVLCDGTRRFFAEKVDNIAVTLDKVRIF